MTLLYRELSYTINGAAMEVHRVLGPGYLEAVYQAALAHELGLRHLTVEQFRRLPISYKGVLVGDYVADMVVEGKIIVEIKAIAQLIPAHRAQAQNYLAATGLRLALLYNFGTDSLQKGRVVWGWRDEDKGTDCTDLHGKNEGGAPPRFIEILSIRAKRRTMVLYTIGHSAHPIGAFIGLLQAHRVEIVADVRSTPSRMGSGDMPRGGMGS